MGFRLLPPSTKPDGLQEELAKLQKSGKQKELLQGTNFGNIRGLSDIRTLL